MKWLRPSLTLLLALALVFTQREGMTHILGHALEHLQTKQSPDSPACEKCQQYAQLGNAVHTAAYSFPTLGTAAETIQYALPSRHASPVAGTRARGPPRPLRKSV